MHKCDPLDLRLVILLPLYLSVTTVFPEELTTVAGIVGGECVLSFARES